MIDLPVEQTKEPSAQARRFAALSGSFDPRMLRGVLRDASADVTLAVLADLPTFATPATKRIAG